MPNWCENTLTIQGDKKDIAKFKKVAKTKTTALSLNKLVPRPKDQENNWYNWNIDHWGTKWDIEAELYDESEEHLVYEFSTAWSPPIVWLEAVSAKYPALEFSLKYDEPSMAFMGVASGSMGSIAYNTIEY